VTDGTVTMKAVGSFPYGCRVELGQGSYYLGRRLLLPVCGQEAARAEAAAEEERRYYLECYLHYEEPASDICRHLGLAARDEEEARAILRAQVRACPDLLEGEDPDEACTEVEDYWGEVSGYDEAPLPEGLPVEDWDPADPEAIPF
jgi:PAS domain-containing protein